jgi:deoxyribonuclease V
MEPVRPEFVPDPGLDRETMEALQRDIAEAAVFADDLDVDPATVPSPTADGDSALVAGVDQAFDGETAVSAVVVLESGAVVERAAARVETEIPYIPGLLSFREGNSVLAAFEALECEPDVVLFDGSGRIHYRQAGLATHVGVTLDVPAVGVIKTLLCGTPRRPVDDPLPVGVRIPIDPDADVEGPVDGPIGYALQTRQFEGSERHVNPVYVSPGHRVGAETAVDLAERCCAGFKLPEPIRLADRHAADLTAA